jgi:hypothetical protein
LNADPGKIDVPGRIEEKTRTPISVALNKEAVRNDAPGEIGDPRPSWCIQGQSEDREQIAALEEIDEPKPSSFTRVLKEEVVKKDDLEKTGGNLPSLSSVLKSLRILKKVLG